MRFFAAVVKNIGDSFRYRRLPRSQPVRFALLLILPGTVAVTTIGGSFQFGYRIRLLLVTGLRTSWSAWPNTCG
jgi:hypothetical protein